MSETPKPQRVRVVRSPAPPLAHTTQDRDDATGQSESLDGLFVSSLVRSQLHTALFVLSAACALIVVAAGGAAFFHGSFPEAAWGGVPVSWLLFAVIVFPGLTGLGWSYLRLSERNEAGYRELLDRSSP